LTGTAQAPLGDPVLLLHGQPGGARDWDLVVAALDRRVQTIVVDRPGWDGRSAARDLPGNAGAALAAIDAAGADRVTVVGHSFGAAVAAWLCTDHPERVGALVLLAPAVNDASLQWIDRWLAAPVLGPLLTVVALLAPGVALSEPRVRSWVGARFGLDGDYLRRAARMLRAPWAWHSFLVEQRALIGQLPALESRLGQIQAPTTIVIGSADRVVPPASAKLLGRQIRDSTLVPVRHAGHLLSLQHAWEIAEITLAASRRSRDPAPVPGEARGRAPGPRA
jgi:pimeloyl-ACP methyl ester carboxylesterase